MMIFEFDKQTNFEFVCDLVIDNNLIANFEDSNVIKLTNLLAEHGITNWQCTLGMNDKLQRTVKVEVHEKLPRLFYYDLTTVMLQYK